jgi:proton glutamate symport protein
MPPMSFGTRVVLGLVAGLAVGALLAAAGNPSLLKVVPALEPVGTLWLSALRMTVIPLIVSMLITAVISAAETAATGRVASRALILIVIALTGAAILSAVLMPLFLTWWPVDPQAVEALRATASTSTTAIPEMPPVREWIVNLIPVNPFKAAAEDAILQVVIFALAFGLGASKLTPELRAPLLGFFRAVMETMFVIIQWVLWVAPLGVFALALKVGASGGVHAAGGLLQYVVLMCVLGVIITILAYPVAVFFGRVPFMKFTRAMLPAQAVAISTQSSLASLPAMLTGARTLGIPERVADITLPLAVSMFRITSPLFNLGIVIFTAHVAGVELDFTRMAIGIALAVLTSFSVVGLPSQFSLFNTTVPISLGMGVPMELLPLIVAVEVVPDIFRTVGNVTADVAVTTVVGRDSDSGDIAR